MNITSVTSLFIFIVIYFTSIPKTQAAISNWVNFELSDGLVKIPVEIAGNKGLAVLDSGSQLNGINKNFIIKHKLKFKAGRKQRVKGVYGVVKRATYSDVEVDLLGQKLPFNSLTEVSLGHYNNAVLLGAAFFSAFILQIDYPNRRLRFMTRHTLDMSEVENLDMVKQKVSGMPLVKVELNNEKTSWLILDTGNNGGVMLERSAARQWLDKYDIQASIAMGANSLGYNESFRLPEMQFGPFILENVLVSVPAAGQKSNLSSRYVSGSRIMGKKVEGLLGFDVLQHFVLTLDYASGKANISPPE